MITANRKDLRFLPAVSDNEIFGIGIVALSWSNIEFLIDLLTRAATGSTFEASGRKPSFRGRAEYLREVAKQQLKYPFRTSLDVALARILDLKGQRDQVVHWLWSEDEKGGAGIQAMDLTKPRSRRIDYGKMQEIAKNIERSFAALSDVIMSAGTLSGRDTITVTEAWEVIRG